MVQISGPKIRPNQNSVPKIRPKKYTPKLWSKTSVQNSGSKNYYDPKLRSKTPVQNFGPKYRSKIPVQNSDPKFRSIVLRNPFSHAGDLRIIRPHSLHHQTAQPAAAPVVLGAYCNPPTRAHLGCCIFSSSRMENRHGT